MNIDKDFIHQLVYRFHNSIVDDGELCDYANTTPENGIYDDIIYQKIYALRYLPAYYFEYCILAERLKNRLINNNHNDINIASFACGLYPDYFALQHNLHNVKFKYSGYDVSNWNTREYLPEDYGNISLYTMSVDSISQREINNFDAFIFPKSLGDIATNADISSLAQKISSTTKDNIYFLNSFISSGHMSNHQHISYFREFNQLLLDNDFTCKDDYKETYFNFNGLSEKKTQGLKGINVNFDYPGDILPLCDIECTKPCNANKYPVLTNQFMDYQILEYTR